MGWRDSNNSGDSRLGSGILARFCIGAPWAKALATVMPVGVASPIQYVVFPALSSTNENQVHLGRVTVGVLNVMPFLKASLLEFVSAILLSVDALCFSATSLCVTKGGLAS